MSVWLYSAQTQFKIFYFCWTQFLKSISNNVYGVIMVAIRYGPFASGWLPPWWTGNIIGTYTEINEVFYYLLLVHTYFIVFLIMNLIYILS